MAGNPVLGFLEAQPVGDDARSTVTKMLRYLGLVLLANLAISLVGLVLVLVMGDSYTGTGAGALVASTAIVGTVIGVALTVAALFWITYTIRAWSTATPSGATHALIIGILAAVFGGLGALGLFGAFGAEPLRMVVTLLSGLLSVAMLLCGILILVNRGKATTTGNATARPTRN